MTRGWYASPLPRLLNERHTLYAGACVMGVVDGDRSLGGWGLIGVPLLPLCRISHRLPKIRRDNTGWVHRRPPLATRVQTPLPCAQILYFCGNINNKQQKGFG